MRKVKKPIVIIVPRFVVAILHFLKLFSFGAASGPYGGGFLSYYRFNPAKNFLHIAHKSYAGDLPVNSPYSKKEAMELRRSFSDSVDNRLRLI